MLNLARNTRPQQVASLSSLTALPKKILTRVVGKLSVEEEYTSQVDLSRERKYEVPLNQLFKKNPHLEGKLAKEALITPCYKENIPFNGAPSSQVIIVVAKNTAYKIDNNLFFNSVYLNFYIVPHVSKIPSIECLLSCNTLYF